MNLPIYSVYDRLAETYAPLTSFTNDRVAARAFKEACETVNGYKEHAGDLEIHRIGWFNDQSGTFSEDKEIIEKGE